MARAMRVVRVPLVVALALCGALPLSLAIAQNKDLTPEPTTKTPTDLTPGTGTTALTPTPTTKPTATGGSKPTATGGSKPTATATVEPTATASASGSASGSASVEPEPSAEPPKPKPAARAFARKKIALGVGDLEVSISMPDTWAEIPDTQLPELENTEHVTVVTRKGFGIHDPKGKPPVVEEVIVACGRAAGDYWADAIRDAAFSEMTSGVEKEARKYTSLKEIEPDAIRSEGDRLLQSFAADSDFVVDGKTSPALLGKGKLKSATTVKLQGLNFIGFHAEGEGKTPQIVACSVACAHLVVEGETSVCAAVIGSIEMSGTFSPAPKRSAMAELLFKLKKDPTTLWLGIVGALFLVVVLALVLILALRKKKPADAHEDEDDDDDVAHIAEEIKTTMHASPPPAEGYFDPQTLARRKI